MKKALLTLIIISSLFVSSVFGMHITRLAKANPNPFEAYPFTGHPIISVYSPLSNSTFSTNPQLNFSMSQPQNWAVSVTTPTGEYKSKVTSVDIIVDGKLYISIEADSYIFSILLF